MLQVGNGIAGTIVPEMLVDSVGMQLDIVRLKLVSPVISKPVGVVIADRDPKLPAVDALMKVLSRLA